ncbi:lipid kinase [Funiculus sociatus GB2-A5]|uniref:Lipid kinase n=1 Tax=Funiculus sociatus GB2-A5 TaxID=2933946 RepID=A0ABV0JTH0_9CYAN|nr:lipid kinase [Trichocoleus sp. FACHB-6]MBD2064845.1 lipid kinase [Trichocoleus sp. FACHB-6]
MNRRALLLVNRHARRGKEALAQAVSKLQELGIDLQEESTEKPKQLPDIIRRWSDRVDLVIIGGGDGTLNAAVDGIVDTQLPLGILPLGTANDLARTLAIPQALDEACQVIANGKQQRIDLGWVNGKHFFNVASLGLSVQITKQLTKEIKQRWGVLAYAVTAIRVVGRSRPFLAEIRSNGESIKVKTVQIAVGNGRYYGGGMTIAEDATINDQRLDLYSLEIERAWEIIPLLPAMKQGQQGDLPGVRTLQSQEIEVYTNKRRPINTDGEITTYTPAKFRLIPQALSIFVPG